MKVLRLIVFLAFGATCGFSAEKLSTVTWEGKEVKEISDVHVTADGKIIIIFAGGGLSTTEDKLPGFFLQSWGITEQQLGKAKSARVKSAEDDFERALRSGLFREVGGIVYDLRKPQPGWTQFLNAKVIQVLDEGVIMDSTPGGSRPSAIIVRHLPRTLGDTDSLTFTAMLAGSYSYINKLGDDRTIRAYDVGRVCGRDEIPTAITERHMLWGKLVGGGKKSREILAQLPKGDAVSASGTGFFISDDGYLLTNFHVVEDAIAVKVKTAAGTFDADVVKKDKLKDLALLRVKGRFTALPLADEASAALGATAFTIGFPNVEIQGLQPKYTDGKISSLSGLQDDPTQYQISVPVQPGNSGGPLMDRNGKVIGVVVARLSDLSMLRTSGSLPQNVNYAIKAKVVREFLQNVSDLNLASPSQKGEDAVKATEKGVALVLVY